MNKTWINRIIYILLLALGLGLVVWVFSIQDLDQMGMFLIQTRWEWVLLSVAATLIGHWVRARRWALLLKGGGESILTRDAFVALMTGYLVNLGIPRLGEATRCLSLNRLSGTPVMKAAGTVLVERAIDIICLLLILVGTIFAASGVIEPFFREQIGKPVVGKLEGKEFLIIGAGFFLLLCMVGLYFFLKMRMGKSWMTWAQDHARKMKDGLVAIYYMPKKILFLLYTLVIWISYFLAPFLSLYALGLAREQAVLVGFVTFVVGSVARSLPVPAGGIGAYQWFIMQVMIVMGYSSEEGLSLATLNFTVQTFFYIAFGALSFILLGIWGRKRI